MRDCRHLSRAATEVCSNVELRDILYVDDERSNLIVFDATFEDDFRIHTASSAAAEALEIVEEVPIPVVIADQRMPDMTGVELFALIRRKHPHIQRVILSGYAESDSIISAINEGQVFQFVRKPWQRPELLAVIRRPWKPTICRWRTPA